MLFLRRHAIFGGTTGSGKSGGLNVLMGNLTACPDVIIWAIDLKRGMELGPWTECIDRLATTPEQAAALLRDAVAILKARAEYLASLGRRTWEPTPEMPALVIIIDEYAELAEEAPDAMHDTDAIARLGRALAVTLVAATQRPTQKVMGQGAVRSQMDLRICFRVREQRDVDLVLGQGMLNAGWNAHKLNAPGKFLVSAPEHDIPRRARAYLVTDEMVAVTAARHSLIPRELDEISRNAMVTPHRRHRDSGRNTRARAIPPNHPRKFSGGRCATAPEEGWEFGELMTITGMSKTPLYRCLRDHADKGRAYQVSQGRWRARPPRMVTMRDRSNVPPSRVSARNGTGRNFGTFTERSERDGGRCPTTEPTPEPMTREQWIAYHVARAPKITKRQWADMLLLLRYGNQEISDGDQNREEES